MRRQIHAIAIAAMSVAVLGILGCNSERDLQRVVGVPQIVEITQDGTRTAASTTVDFGATLLRAQVDREVLIRNDGRASFTVTGVNKSDNLSGAFKFADASFLVAPNEQVVFKVSFMPTEPGQLNGTLTLLTTGQPEELTIDMVGSGVDGKCNLSSTTLDFGSTAVGSSYPRQVSVYNQSTLGWQITIEALDAHGGAAAFEFGAGFAPGVHTVPPASSNGTPGELIIPVEFRPSRVGEYSSELVIESSICPTPVVLHGVGVAHVLECDPTVQVGGADLCRVDFGFVNPNTRATAQVFFRNLGNNDINLTLASITQPPVDGETFAIESVTRTFVVPQGGAAAAVELSFAPQQMGEMVGRLNFTSDDPNRPSGFVELVGIGGGPQIEAQPAQLDFNKVAIYTYQVRRITIANVGTNVIGTEDDNLRLAVKDGEVWIEKQAEISGPDAADFSLEWPPQGYTPDGLSEGESADLRVRFSPTTWGPKNAVVTIYSSDPQHLALQVPLTGLAADLLPCDFDIKPPTLNFGSVESNKYLTLNAAIINRDPDPTHQCLVSMLDMTRATVQSGAFALVNGPLESATIDGGGALLIPVRFQPKTDGTYNGELEFYISSPTRPEVKVALTGVAQASCLMIAPRELDFGTIGINCRSRERVFTMYNTCSNSLTVTAIDMQQGQSTEFAVTKKPALPVTISGGASSDFGVTYHPVDSGDDAATVAVTLSGNPNPLIVPLTGRGALDPVQTDVFSQSDQPKVDVMLIIDNSCSMDDKQQSLARNFASFIHYAVQQKVDYHIAATTVSIDSNPPGGGGTCETYAQCGRFVPLTGSNPRVITPSTPNKEQVFTQNVHLGTDGTGTESLIRPGYLALTNPLINGHNAGFYRDEAKLAIVVVSDAADQDPLATPVSFYESFYLNLKGIKRRNDFTFSGIIPTLANGPGAGCSYDSYDAGQDPRVKQLIQRTGGLVDEICNPDWSKTLEKLGTRVFGLRTTFFLSNMPDMTAADPIVITVDGQPYPQFGTKGDKRWDYNSASNAVEFDPLAVPDPGATLSISYHVACL